jgi:hypothetical protein
MKNFPSLSFTRFSQLENAENCWNFRVSMGKNEEEIDDEEVRQALESLYFCDCIFAKREDI